MRSLTLLFVPFLLFQGCFYSSWESLEYEAVNCPKSHGIAEVALIGGLPSQRFVEAEKDVTPDRYEAFKIGEVMCSVMLCASGCYQQERGPYTVWLSFAERHKRKEPDKIIMVKSVLVRRSGVTLWRHEGFSLRLDQRNEVNYRMVGFGDRKMVLPDILNPKDEKYVRVEVTVESEDGTEKTLGFDFRPIVKTGKMQTLD